MCIRDRPKLFGKACPPKIRFHSVHANLHFCSQHFQKMRKDSRAQLGEPATSKKGGNSTKSTPRKPKAPNGNGETPSKAGKRKEVSTGPGEADDDESESPSKKMKAEDDGEEWLA